MTAPTTPPQGPAQGGPQGPQHFTPPPAAPVSQSSSRRNLVIASVLAGGGCLLVVLAIVVIVLVTVLRGGSAGGGDGSPSASASPEEQAKALATEYTDALVAGDAEQALALSTGEQIEDGQLLPVEAYAAALESAPVADVEIGAPVMDTGGLASGTVPLSFTVGGEPASMELSVHDFDDDGILELVGVGVNTSVPPGAESLGMTLNGAEIGAAEYLYLLPGGYELGLGAEHFAPESTDPLLVTDAGGLTDWPEATLTEEGLTAFRGAVQESVDACLAETSLAGGCGMGEVPAETSDGWASVDGTVERSISEETQRTIDTMEATGDYDEPTYVEGSGAVGTVSTTYECTKDGQTGICELVLGGGMSVPHVDMADPELPVTWS